VISVIRRVDENWAEGKLGDRIGIFPLAFVEMNQVARALMKLSTKYVYRIQWADTHFRMTCFFLLCSQASNLLHSSVSVFLS
jgi:hypothetical protein